MLKPFFAKQFAKYQHTQTKKILQNPIEQQKVLFHYLIEKGKQTKFGVDHNFQLIQSYKDYISQVPLFDYEQLKPYIDEVKNGTSNVLWTGVPKYFNKTSGTTSGAKYIPMTSESLPHSIKAARSALLAYIMETNSSNWVNGKMIFLSGSPKLDKKENIPVGRMSGIVNHHIPAYLRRNQLPSYQTNCIEDWEEKLDEIVEETKNQNLTLISGIPPWLQMYFDLLLKKTGKKSIKQIFPNLEIIVHGGVNFKPYETKMKATVGGNVSFIETYPASEGFIAYQNSQSETDLLLNLDAGIFYEFIPADEIFTDNPTRLSLAEVELGVNYALVLTTDAGLWSYNIGDTIKFTSLKPHRIIVTGRTKHFISAFGEHVIGEEVESAMFKTIALLKLDLREFTVAPQVNPTNGALPYHEWFIELEKPIDESQIKVLRESLDQEMCLQNTYYRDLIEGKVLQNLKVTILPIRSFEKYMASIGKLGGQNKVPRLSNNRKIADTIVQL